MTLHTGDCLEVMPTLVAGSVDAVVTDPPYGLEFMGKAWDKLEGVGKVSTWGTWPGQRGRATVMPGANANVRCRNCNGWKVGRATNKSKCRCIQPDFPDLGQSAGRPMQEWHHRWAVEALRAAKPGAYLLAFGGTRTVHRMTCAIEDAGWVIRDVLVWAYAQGFPKSRASLKPAWEPIVMARKPGASSPLQIDAARIGTFQPGEYPTHTTAIGGSNNNWQNAVGDDGRPIYVPVETPAGRWPSNVLLTDPIFDGDVPGVVGGGEAGGGYGVRGRGGNVYGDGNGYTTDFGETGQTVGYGDTGTYSRFFLIPKADRAEREPIWGHDLVPRAAGNFDDDAYREPGQRRANHTAPKPRANHHPTVKPLDLMRHLVRLVTPPGGTVLDPFLGSGTTAIACEMEGFPWIGIEREESYVAIAEARLLGTQRGMGLPA